MPPAVEAERRPGARKAADVVLHGHTRIQLLEQAGRKPIHCQPPLAGVHELRLIEGQCHDVHLAFFDQLDELRAARRRGLAPEVIHGHGDFAGPAETRIQQAGFDGRIEKSHLELARDRGQVGVADIGVRMVNDVDVANLA